MGMDKGICCVADQFCIAAANFEPPVYVKTQCFACGDFVCTKCSIRADYYQYGKQRLCHNCLIDYKDSNELVIAHLHRLGK